MFWIIRAEQVTLCTTEVMIFDMTVGQTCARYGTFRTWQSGWFRGGGKGVNGWVGLEQDGEGRE